MNYLSDHNNEQAGSKTVKFTKYNLKVGKYRVNVEIQL